MKTEQILMYVVTLILGMFLFHMLKNVCGCKLVEGLHHAEWPPRRGIGDSCLPAAPSKAALQSLAGDIDGLNHMIDSIGPGFDDDNCMINDYAVPVPNCNRWRDGYPPSTYPPPISQLCTGGILSHPAIRRLADIGDPKAVSMLYYFNRDCCCKVDRDTGTNDPKPPKQQTCYAPEYHQWTTTAPGGGGQN